MSLERVEAVICGGGIAGLAAAHGLANAGVPFVLLEGSPRWGGRIRTEREAGFLLEAGPDSLLAQKAAALELCRTLGLADRLLPARRPGTVYILRRGRLEPLPPGMAGGCPSSVAAFLRSPLFSWSGKARMALEPLVPRRRQGDESIAGFFRRRLGREALELIGQPLLAGIHAGNAERLSLPATMPALAELERRCGSLWRGMAPSRRSAAPAPLFYTLRDGLQELVEALVARLPACRLRSGTRLRALRRESAGGFRLETESGLELRTRCVVLAVPAPAAAGLLPRLDPAAAVLLSDIPFVSTATVLLGYRRQDVGHPLDGHGLLVPRAEGLRTTACSFVSSKFDFRAPEGHVLLRAFVGGAHDTDALSLGAEGLRRTVQRELAALLDLRGDPCTWRVFPWPASMPQMEVGHAARMAALERRLELLPGLFLTGAGLRGTGVPDAIADGLQTASAVASFLGTVRAA